ncbi:MAG TPA: hypothetical protein VM600_10090, partial [Actinomycetota bacterium]|nr:hypothetical protein [Actinomycetota bacterium]
KMLPLPVRNDGGETLTFQISSDREYITMRGARGSVPSGATATVLVTYDYDRALDGARDVPLPVTSNAGRDTVRVLGLTDSIGPHVGDNDMKTLHRHCSGGTCSDFRHARADITDASSAVVSAKLHYRVCRGAGSAAPACGEWRLQEMPHISGTLYQADAGPLPACAPQLTVVVHYRVIARDDLGNESYTPGNSTWFFGPHCRP